MSTLLQGVFIDVQGLAFTTGANTPSIVKPDGYFEYEEGREVTFLIGSLALGSTLGKEHISFLDLAQGTPSTENVGLLNRARLLFSLVDGLGFEKSIIITDQIRAVISKYSSQINLDAPDPTSLDDILAQIGTDLGITPKTIPHTRNHIRRALAGFKVRRDIKIPVRDGNFVYADIYLPLDPVDKYPVLLASTIYGKRVVYSGPDLSDPLEIAEFERAEDQWFTTPSTFDIKVPHTTPTLGRWADQRRFETTSSFNTFLWVPRGYAMVKVDPRGVGQSPGTRNVPGQETSDIFDAVEWAAAQEWSSGAVCLTGNSYGANVQWPVAALKPKGLKCFIPFGCDVDQYRDISYQGGISHAGYLKKWLSGVRTLSPRWEDTGGIYGVIDEHPFYNDFWKATADDLASVDIPVLMASSQVALVHGRGPFEAWHMVGSKDKHIEMVDGNYYSWPNHECASKLVAFAERYLKGRPDIDLERVGIQMRLGNKEWYWRTDTDWPIPDTEYIKFYLHADQSLSATPPSQSSGSRALTYPAEAYPKGPSAGVSFISEPLTEDIEFAGHFAAKLHISSTTHDADVVVHIWALDEKDNAVVYCLRNAVQPLNSGFLRASHRRLDAAKSRPERPYHTHLETDYAPLKFDEIAELDVELAPASARVKAGWKIRVDICPSDEQPNVPGFKPAPHRIYPGDIHDGAINAVHVGAEHVNWVLLPKVPLRDLSKEEPLESIEY